MSQKALEKLALAIVLSLDIEDEKAEDALLEQLLAVGNQKREDETQVEEFIDLLELLTAKKPQEKQIAAQTFLAASALYTRTSQFVATARTAMLACIATGLKSPLFFLTKKIKARGVEEAGLYVAAKAELAKRKKAALAKKDETVAASTSTKASKAPKASKEPAKASSKAKASKKKKEESSSSSSSSAESDSSSASYEEEDIYEEEEGTSSESD